MLTETVPKSEYERMKTHYIHRTETLTKRNQVLTQTLLKLVKIHHGTVTGSKLHDPSHQDWENCKCLTCKAVAKVLPEHAEISRGNPDGH